MNAALILKAAHFASEKHKNQRRKDVEASPYINHPLALASVLAVDGGVEQTDVLCAALLHDTIEDTDTTAEELTGIFGAKIASIVLEVTNNPNLPKVEQKADQAHRAPLMSTEAKLVKLADKICNLRDILNTPPTEWSADRKRDYFDSAAKVVAGLRCVHPKLEAVFDEVYAQRSVFA